MPHKDLLIRAIYHKEYAKRRKKELQEYRNNYRKDHPEEERKWQDAYREKTVEKRRAYIRYKRYGVDSLQFETMLELQDNRCAICREVFTRTPHTDHCHTSGKVRGLLCGSCNTGLGVYEKKKELFKRYLDEQQ